MSVVESRVVGNDYTIAWRSERYRIPAGQAKPRMRKQQVQIEQRLDGGLWLRWGGQQIELEPCREAVAAPAPIEPALKPNPKPKPKPKSKAKPNRAWMDGFWIGDPAKRRPPLSAAALPLRAPFAADKGA